MEEFFARLFDTSDFTGRWYCGHWSAGHGWLHIGADLATFGAYTAIPCVLAYFVLRRKDVPFPGIFWLFCAFIFACGAGHLVEAILFWHPIYRFSGLVKVTTALVSWATVAVLIPAVPRALALRSPGQLNQEVARRTQALRDSVARTAAIVETAGDGIMTLDEHGLIQTVNHACERLFGFPTADMVGHSVSQFVGTPAPDGPVEDQKVRTGENITLGLGSEILAKRPDGTTFPVSLAMSKTRVEGKQVYTTIVHDLTKLKETEERLRHSEARLRMMLAQVPAVLCTTDRKLKITLFSCSVATGLSHLGLKTNRFVGVSVTAGDNHLLKFLPGQAFSRALQGESVTVEVRWEERIIEFHIEALYDAAHQVVGTIGLGLDSTERKRTEAALRRSEAQMRAIVEAAVDGIFIISEDGIIQSVNPACERLFGYTAQELLGRNISLLMPAPYQGEHDQYLRNYLATGQKKIIGIGREVAGQRKDGSSFPMDLSVSEVRLGPRRLFTGIVHDISSRKHAEERFRLAVEAAPSGMVMINSQGTILLVNPQTEQLFGYPREELIGQPVEILVPERFRSKHHSFRQSYLAGPETRRMGSGRNLFGLRKDGSEFPVEIGLNPIQTEHGILVLSAIVDITERKRGEEAQRFYAEQLQQQNAELLRSNQELDEFAYIASHDLKEPLRGLHNYATFLLEDYADKLDEAGQAKLQTLKYLTQRMESLIDSLLHYSRVGRVDLAVQNTDLNKVVHEVLDSLRITLEEQGVEVRMRGPLPTLRCDRVRIAEVFRNLVSNALKYNDKPQKTIDIGAAAHGEEGPAGEEGERRREASAVLYVRDNGIGISPRHWEAIFRIFKRLHGRDKFGGGTGVGLTIVKKIIERHCGRIWVQSEPGQGTTFYFTLAAR